MTTPAILMLIISALTVWGGLVAAIVNLRRHPEVAESEPEPPVEL